jgi:hypothetical protein
MERLLPFPPRLRFLPRIRSFSGNASFSGNGAFTFSPATYQTLTIEYGDSHGTTTPSAGQYQEITNTSPQVTCTPNSGYVLNYWSLDGTNVGNTNPIPVLMNANHTLEMFTTSSTPLNTGNLGSFVMPQTGNILDFNAYLAGGEFGYFNIAIEDSSGNALWGYGTTFPGEWTAIPNNTLATVDISQGSPTGLTLTGGTTYQLVGYGVYYPGNKVSLNSASIDYLPT